MKKYILLILISIGMISLASAQQPCICPDHIIIRDSINCNFVELSKSQTDASYANTDSTAIRACQFSTMKYSIQALGQAPCVFPNFSVDTIIVSGGTLINFTNSNFTIQWGGANTGTVQIQFSIPGGGAGTQGCNGIITLQYKLIPNPIAAFVAAPNPACFNNPTNISFNSSGSVGALSYFWDFGDGFTSTSPNPVHSYTSPGSYLVCLTVANTPGGQGGTAVFGACPSCSDSVCHTVVINNLPGPDIDCIATVCAGATETYCTVSGCSTYNWVITGGTIISPNPSTSNCVTILWGSGNPQGNIHVDMPGCPGYCSQGSDFTVPIIPSATTITGSNIVCVGTTSAYYLPAFPGTTYSWNISGGQFINGNNTNTTNINTTWNNIGTYTITCVYFDTALNCGGTGTIVVNVLPEMKVTGPKKRCAGQFSTLQASLLPAPFTPVNCNWTISPAGASIVGPTTGTSANFSWTNPGTYLVTATPTVSNIVCAPISYTVIVYPQPILSSINGPDSICANGVSTYSANSNMAGLFTWTIIGGTPSFLGPNNDSVQITWNNSGPYSISVNQLSYANNCPSNTLNKTVFAYPTPIVTGPTLVCADALSTYNITNIASTNFNWHITPAQFGTVISSPGVNPVIIKWHGNNNPGGTNVVYLHYGNCNDDSIAITITEPLAPTITQTGSLCVGSGITLTSTGSGTFSWSHLEAPPYSSATNTLSNVNDPGHYTVQIITAAGCTLTKTINIPSIGMPIAQIYAAGPITYCAPATVNTTLNALTGGGYSYQWHVGGSPIPGATNASYNLNPGNTASTPATYFYHCVVMKGGCTATSNTIVINVITCPTGGGGTGTSCPGAIDITNISGCNPFNITAVVTNGVYIIPGSESIIHFEDGLILSGNTTRSYTSVGSKLIRLCVDVKLADSSICTVCKDTNVLVTVAAKFLKNVNCGTITLTDLSTSFAPVTIPVTGYSWSVTPSGSFNSNTIPNPILTLTSTGTYTITQSVTGSNGCVSTYSEIVSVTLPDASFNVNPISCVGTTVNLNNLFPAPINYWNFGDLTSSNTSPTFHAYAATGPYLITHTVTDAFGCTDTKSNPINIIAAPVCTITITGLTTFCSGDSVKLNACVGYSSYQWKKNGVAISGATSSVYYATQTGNYSFIAIDPNGCDVNSDTFIITVLQAPSTSMITTEKKCFGELFTTNVPSCAGCMYQWEVDGIVIVPFGAANSYSETVGNPPFTLGSHLIKVTIIGANGCISKDSITVIFNPQPTVSIAVTGNPPQLCSNNIYTFTATTNANSPVWAWTYANFNSILSSTNTLIASTGGLYTVLVTDGITGCTNSAIQNIDESPDLSLFPIGCDTLCQNTSIFLPLASFNGNVSGYTITWYDNAPPYIGPNIVGTGTSLNLNSLALGAHNLSVIVVGPNGCVDTSNVYYIFIVPSTSSNITVSTCGTYTWMVNGITYTASGTYTSTSINASGCPQYDTLNLSINQGIDSVTNATACGSYLWLANGQTYTASGTYTFTTLLANGCIKYNILVLTITNGSSSSTSVSICGSYTWALNGVTYTSSGIYTYTTINNGCVHTDSLLLNILPNTSSTQTHIACDTYTWNGVTYTASGTYTHTVLNANGCLHTSTLVLTINPTNITTLYITACGIYTWTVNGVTYTASGVYTHTTLGTNGCPHIYVLCLTIAPNTESSSSITVCDSYTWPANGITYTSSGIYTYTSLNANGCIHTSILNLTVNYSTSSSVSVTACNTYTWPLNGITYTSSGTYTFTTNVTPGCPHITTLNLTITNGETTSVTVIACDSYTWMGTTYTASGTYTNTSYNTNGCLITHTLNLTINTSNIITTYINVCGPYTWSVNGVTYTASGVYTVMTIGANGCPQLYVLCLTVYPNTSGTITVTACNQYTWAANGMTYTASGTFTHTLLNAYGCLQTAILNLTINQGVITTSVITACNSYTWPVNGLTYTVSGNYTFTTMGTNGCPNTYLLQLTIHPSNNSSATIVACDEYLWPVNGVTYTASGIYTFTSMSSAGCLNTWTLNLTINHSTTSDLVIVACDSYTWPANGITYTASGQYTFTSLNSQGCIHTSILILTINHSSSSSITVAACDSYTWPVNGITYTSSGTYTFTSINSVGCVHTSTLILTLGTTSTTHIFDTACCSYTWALNGVTYTSSGIYTYFTTGPEGCPHFYILCVTIHPCNSTSTSVTACGSYTWAANGVTYTQSGTYTTTLLNNYGCLITDTLQVIIGTGGVTTTSSCDSVCDFYTWPINGVTYTASGVYTYITYDSFGCPHLYIKCITIRHHTDSVISVTATQSYTWSVTGITYTNSGVYTTTLTNSIGCDSLLMLDLQIIIPPANLSISARAMLSGPYKANTGLMSDSLRVYNLIPLNEPYSGTPFFKLQLLGGGGETTTAAVLGITGNNAIVDWVHIEIRSATNNSIIIATKNALIQRDGDIVNSLDGVSPISFPLLPNGNYFVSIKHRNHLGIMTATPIPFVSGNYSIDFTTVPLYTVPTIVNNAPANFTGSLNLMWSGDPNSNKNVKYNGIFNDKDPILYTVGIATPNNCVYGYRLEDLNLDGKVRYNNTDNDRAIILSNVGATTPNKVLWQHTPN